MYWPFVAVSLPPDSFCAIHSLASASDPLTVAAGAEVSAAATVSSATGALAAGAASSTTSVVSATGAETVSS